MTQILDPIPADNSDTVLCCYVNSFSKIQVVRITNIPNWYFERVVFPGQRLMFEALAEGQLEIHSGSMASSILEDTVPCLRLRIEQAEDALSDITVNSALELGDDTPSTLKNARQPVHG